MTLNWIAPEALKPVKSKPSALTITLMVAALLIGVTLVFLLAPFLATVAGLLLSVVPVLLTIAGLYSCVTSLKATNIKLLWVVIIVLAPLLGPLLWFFWGKQHT